MTLLAENTAGMHNLFRLSSLASIEGYYFKPRMDRELLQHLRVRPDRAPPAARAARCRPGCGSDSTTRRARPPATAATSSAKTTTSPRSWITASASSARVMGDLLRLAKELDLPLLATNDLHYTHAHDSSAHEILLCVQSGSTMDDPNRFKLDWPRVLPEVGGADAAAVPPTIPRPATTPC